MNEKEMFSHFCPFVYPLLFSPPTPPSATMTQLPPPPAIQDLVPAICTTCNVDFPCLESETVWRKTCPACFKTARDNDTRPTRACDDCGREFRHDADQAWRNYCASCYRTRRAADTRTVVSCGACGRDFRVEDHQTWKKLCGGCFRTKKQKRS